MDIKDAVLNVMGTSFFGNLVTLIVGLFGMAGVVYTVKKSQKSAFTSAYFSQKLSAYSDFIQCIERYLWHPDKEATDDLAASLYCLRLFAPDDLFYEAQVLYEYAHMGAEGEPLAWGSVQSKIDALSQKMLADIRKEQEENLHPFKSKLNRVLEK